MEAKSLDFVGDFLPERAVPSGLLAVVAWLDPDTGQQSWRLFSDFDGSVLEAIGMLETAKRDLMHSMAEHG